jgi:hypothetical protein
MARDSSFPTGLGLREPTTNGRGRVVLTIKGGGETAAALKMLIQM